MIDLSQKAAIQYKQKWQVLSEREGDFWKVDICYFERTPMLLIVHEQTLFTVLRKQSLYSSIQSIADEIHLVCPWYKFQGDLTLGKNSNKKLNGSINEIKRMTSGIFSPEQINSFEMRINTHGLFSYLSREKYGYGHPTEAVDLYVKGLWP